MNTERSLSRQHGFVRESKKEGSNTVDMMNNWSMDGYQDPSVHCRCEYEEVDGKEVINSDHCRFHASMEGEADDFVSEPLQPLREGEESPF